jgi:hypothetical protein
MGASPSAAPTGINLTGTDCPPDLVRCSGKGLERSLAGHVPMGCQGEACVCPYAPVGRCDTRCLVEGEPLVLPPGVPPEQLCAPWAAAEVWSALGPQAAAVTLAVPCHEGETVRCMGGETIDCAQQRVVGRCANGCVADDGLSIEGDAGAAAMVVLCRRGRAKDAAP